MSTTAALLQTLAREASEQSAASAATATDTGARTAASALVATAADIQRLIDNGLGPLAFESLQQGRIEVDADSAEALHAADLTARVVSDQWDRSLHELIGRLNEREVLPVLLKGASVRYRYAQRHHRLMGDIDLLVRADEIDTTIAILDTLGYVTDSEEPASHYLSHHHIAPRRHPELGIWIEVHTGLDSSAWFQALNRYTDEHCLEPVRELPDGLAAKRLNPAVELHYIAAHWYLHLMENLGTRGLQRALVDASVLVSSECARPDPVAGSWWRADCMALPVAARRPENVAASPARDIPDAAVRFTTLALMGAVRELYQPGRGALQQTGQQTGQYTGQNAGQHDSSLVDVRALSVAHRVILQDVISLQPRGRLIHQMVHAAWLELALTSSRSGRLRLRLRQATSTAHLLARALTHHGRALFRAPST